MGSLELILTLPRTYIREEITTGFDLCLAEGSYSRKDTV